MRALAAALGVSDDDRVGARRAAATSTPTRHGAFLDGQAAGPRSVRARRHGSAVAAIRAAVAARRAHLRARRLRRGRHLRDGARRAAPARARRRRRVASAVAVRGGLRAERRHARHGSPRKASISCSRSTAASPRSPRSSTRASLGLEVVVTDHHRPGRRRFPACPVVAPLKGDYPFAGLCGTGVVWKLAQALLGEEHPFCDRHLDVVALATVADVVPLVDENRALALLGLRRARADAEAGAARADAGRGRRPGRRRRDRRSASASRRGSTRPAVCAGRRPRSRCSSPRTTREAKQLAEELEALNRERQSVEERILREAVAEVESWPEGAPPPARLRRRGRGLARGRDRHRRLAARRAVRPAGRPDRRQRTATGRARADRSPRSTCTARSPPASGTSTASAATGPRPGSRSAPTRSRRSPRPSPRTRTQRSPTTTCGPSPRSTRSSPARSSGSRCARSSAGSRPFGLGNPGVTLLVDDCELDRLDTSVTASTCASASASAAATPARRSRSASARSSTATAASGRYDVAFRLQENRWNGTVAPQLVVRRVFDADRAASRSCAPGSREQWQAGETAWTPDARHDLRRAGARRRWAPAACSSRRRSGRCSRASHRSQSLRNNNVR